MTIAARVRDIVEPLLATRGLEVFDVEHNGGQLRVTVDRESGVDLAALADATRVVSRALDQHDPIPTRYTLEVSSPGLERTLRLPAHYERAIGSVVRVKLLAGTEGDRRTTGTLTGADGDGITLRTEDADERRIAYRDIDRTRTVFEWGPAPRPGRPRTKQKAAKTKAETTSKEHV